MQSTIPTQAERNGDLSQLLSAGSNYQIYDPLTGVSEGARIRRQPFANNMFPASRISSIAKNYLPLFPLPNQPGRSDGRDNLVIGDSGERNFFHNEISRMDFVASERHKIFFSMRHNERAEKDVDELGHFVEAPSGNNVLKRENWGTMVDDVHTFTPPPFSTRGWPGRGSSRAASSFARRLIRLRSGTPHLWPQRPREWRCLESSSALSTRSATPVATRRGMKSSSSSPA